MVGIDHYMSEPGALATFSGHAVATLVLNSWVKQVDTTRVNDVLAGRLPFDEAALAVDPHASPTAAEQATEGPRGPRSTDSPGPLSRRIGRLIVPESVSSDHTACSARGGLDGPTVEGG